MKNVLLNLTENPDFADLKATDIEPAITELLTETKQNIEKIKSISPISWENNLDPLAATIEKIQRAWNVVTHINTVKDTEAWRNAYNKLIPLITNFFSEISQDEEIFKLYQTVQEKSAETQLNSTQQTILKHELQDFELSGVSLEPQKKQLFSKLNEDLSVLATQFSQNVLDSTDDFELIIADKEQLKGLSSNDLEILQHAAESEGKTGYKIGLQIPFFQAIIRFAEDRQLREKIHYAYTTRASELNNDGRWNNAPNIDQILVKDYEQAKLLGYPSAAEVSLVRKMASSPQQVFDFIFDIVHRAKPFAIREFEELQEFSAKELKLAKLEPWDINFASEKLREHVYNFSENEVKQYFSVDQVLSGLFGLIEELYQVSFVEEKRSVWHPDVKYYNLFKNKQKIGGVYFDIYARAGKKSGAWMDAYCSRWKRAQDLTLPIAFLVCNFTPPKNNQAVYLAHQEITTLFHEMGHCLHHLLTQVDEIGASGINGVEWDAVELPSQFMENFAWEYDILAAMSKHKETGEKLPKALFDKMFKARNFQVGLFLLRQMEFALFDMRIYSEEIQPCAWEKIMQDVRNELSVLPQAAYNRFPNSFEHIFAGGYSAGYYSYIWAEVLSADVYEAFVESNNRKATGQLFLQEILSRGGSRPAMDSFVAFRGRKPTVDALFKHLGLN